MDLLFPPHLLHLHQVATLIAKIQLLGKILAETDAAGMLLVRDLARNGSIWDSFPIVLLAVVNAFLMLAEDQTKPFGLRVGSRLALLPAAPQLPP